MLPLTQDDRDFLIALWKKLPIPRRVIQRWRRMGLADQWGPTTIAFEIGRTLAS